MGPCPTKSWGQRGVQVSTGEWSRGSEGTGPAHQAYRQDQGRGNCKYPYSIRGNENKGENSLWFDTPTGQAVFFSPHLLS